MGTLKVALNFSLYHGFLTLQKGRAPQVKFAWTTPLTCLRTVRVHSLAPCIPSMPPTFMTTLPSSRRKASNSHRSHQHCLWKTTQKKDTPGHLPGKHFFLPYAPDSILIVLEGKILSWLHPSSIFKYNLTNKKRWWANFIHKLLQWLPYAFSSREMPTCPHLISESRPGLRLYWLTLSLKSLRCPLHTSSPNDTSPFPKLALIFLFKQSSEAFRPLQVSHTSVKVLLGCYCVSISHVRSKGYH